MRYTDNTPGLLRQYGKAIAGVARHYALEDTDLRSDLVGEGIVTLLEVNDSYNDQAYSYPFKIYVMFRIKDRMRAYLKDRSHYVLVGLRPGEEDGEYAAGV